MTAAASARYPFVAGNAIYGADEPLAAARRLRALAHAACMPT